MGQAILPGVLAIVLGAASGSVVAAQGDRLPARWIGQVGSDRVGRAMTPGPNGVQDMVIELAGLPPREEVVRAVVRGHGGDIWGYRDPGGHWSAELERPAGSDRARLLLEPLHEETGRSFSVEVELADGRLLRSEVQGGRADPFVRMPEVQLAARWAGLDGLDRTGSGPSVGPDGEQDVRIDLARLDSDPEITELLVRAEGGPSWSYGPNPDGNRDALLLRAADDRSRAALYLSPAPGLEGRRVRIDLSYSNGTADRTVIEAGSAPTGRPANRPAVPPLAEEAATVRWLGQDDRGPLGPGAVRLVVDRASKDTPRAVVLGDGVVGCWAFERPSGLGNEPMPFLGGARRLELTEGPRPGSFELAFIPYRDLEEASMTLRVIDADGRSSIVRFPGQACDPTRSLARPSVRRARVEPGDDLAAVVADGGTVTIAPGVYRLDGPLDLPKPTALIAEPGAEFRFRQRQGDVPWGEAVAIRGSGVTTIDGLRVRFDGPVRWHPGAHWGGAIVGVPNLGTRPGGPVRVELRGLDLEAPPASTDWEEAPNCIRLIDTDSGTIEGCTLKGGSTVLSNGPWKVAGNRHRGTMPRTSSGGFVVARMARDFEVVDNEVRPEPPSGKLYRFLVLADRGAGVTVRGNRVIGVGARDDDERPHPNAPEVLLTEAYLVRYEGRLGGLSADGRVLAIPEPQGAHPEVGEAVAVLSGPDAGKWAVVAQVLDRNVLLLDRPLPAGDYAISITPGFLGTTIAQNTIDCRGSTQAHPVVLTGNHYGTKLVGNTLMGGGHAFRIAGYVTGQPVHYAWTHTPQFGLEVAENTVVDSALGGRIAVHHEPGQKTNRGRVYLSGSVSDNTFRWTADDLPGPGKAPVALVVGMAPSLDPGELVLTTGRNQAVDAQGRPIAEPMRIEVGTVNGRPYGSPAGP